MIVMKKLLLGIICCAVLFCCPARAQQPMQYSIDLSAFSAMDLSGPFQVSVVQGTQYRALITVLEPYREYVECYVNAGVMTLTLDEKRVPAEVKRQFRAKGTADPVFSAIVYVPQALQEVSMSGKALLHDSDDIFDKEAVSFNLDGQAQVKSLSLATSVFKLDMEGKSVADFNVTCRESIVKASQSAQLAIDEHTESSFYKVQGSAKLRMVSNCSHFEMAAKSNCVVHLSGRAERATFDMGGTCEVDGTRFDVSDADVTMSSVCKLCVAASRKLKVNLNGGSTLHFAGDPVIEIDNIRSATMSHLYPTGAAAKATL